MGNAKKVVRETVTHTDPSTCDHDVVKHALRTERLEVLNEEDGWWTPGFRGLEASYTCPCASGRKPRQRNATTDHTDGTDGTDGTDNQNSLIRVFRVIRGQSTPLPCRP